MTHQPAISFSISFQPPFNRAGGRTSNVGQETHESEPISMKTIIVLAAILIANLSVGQSEPTQIETRNALLNLAKVRAGLRALNMLPDDESKILCGHPLIQQTGTTNRPAGTVIIPVKPNPEAPIEVYFWENSYGQFVLDLLVNGEPKNLNMKVPELDEQDKAYLEFITYSHLYNQTKSADLEQKMQKAKENLDMLKKAEADRKRAEAKLEEEKSNRAMAEATIGANALAAAKAAGREEEAIQNEMNRLKQERMRTTTSSATNSGQIGTPREGADPKAALTAIDTKIAAERKRWTDATAVINRLTNFKKTPVQEGTQAYYKCVEASKIIQEVEAGAEALKQEKSRLEDEFQKPLLDTK